MLKIWVIYMVGSGAFAPIAGRWSAYASQQECEVAVESLPKPSPLGRGYVCWPMEYRSAQE